MQLRSHDVYFGQHKVELCSKRTWSESIDRSFDIREVVQPEELK